MNETCLCLIRVQSKGGNLAKSSLFNINCTSLEILMSPAPNYGKFMPIIADEVVSLCATVPDRKVGAVELIPVYQLLTNQIESHSIEQSLEAGKKISCKNGCASCCIDWTGLDWTGRNQTRLRKKSAKLWLQEFVSLATNRNF
jgi:uncharacterized protein YbdZ (MbtH family)